MSQVEIREGVVEHIDFSNGGAGACWVTVDGVRYSISHKELMDDWGHGDKVSFRAGKLRDTVHGALVDFAGGIRRVT